MPAQTVDANGDSVEGLEDDRQPALWPADSINSLLIRNENRTVHEVLRRINAGRYVMNPDFQRDFIWDEEKQSKLIESVIMRIPLPVLYLAEDEEGRMIVVDGLQRLSTFKRYFDNKLKLKLKDRPELNGKRFRDLSPKLQNRIEDCNLILYVIDSQVPERARLDIFERVNGGVALTRQQMRNCLFMGNATRFLRDEAQTELFLNATGHSLNARTMRDREFVNRFCAFQMLDVSEYKGDMDDFLAMGLKQMNNSSETLGELSGQFRTALNNNLRVFGKHAFRKHKRGQDGRSVLNASLWDVMSTGLSHYSELAVGPRTDSLRTRFYRLMDDEKFITAITYGPNDPKKVAYRFAAVRRALSEVFDADAP